MLMSLSHASSGEVISIRPLEKKLGDAVSVALLKTSHLEVMRLVLLNGRSIPEHRVAGEMTIQCIEGAVELHAHGTKRILHAGDLVYLEGGQPYAFHAIEDCSILHTILLSHPSLSQGPLR
jgi:quercetin dioxygenase-like cupin family protein